MKNDLDDYNEYDYHAGDSLTDAGWFGLCLAAAILFISLVWWMVA